MMDHPADNLIRREDESFVELALCYLDNEATPDQVRQLDQSLREDVARRRQFVTLAIQAQCMAEAVRPPAEAQRRYGKLENDDSSADVLMEVLEIEREAARRRARERSNASESDCGSDSLDDRLRLLLGEPAEPVTPVRHIVIPRAAVYAVLGGLTATAAGLLLVAYTMLFPPEASRGTTVVSDTRSTETAVDAPPPTAMPATRLVAAVNPQWANGQKQWQTGELLPTHQPFTLASGLLKLRFDNGAETIVRGPARFELLSPTTLWLTSGEVLTRCEGASARGFTVETPYARIVDIGTEFGVRTDEEGTEAHVLAGKIVMTSLPAEPDAESVTVPLSAGFAGRVSLNDPQVRTMQAAGHTFVDRQDFEAHVLAESGSRYHRAVAFSHELRRDPSLLAYYTFEPETVDGDRVRNVALATSGRLDGVLTGMQPTAQPLVIPGRFEHSRALDFTPIGDVATWLEVAHDPAFETLDELTLAAWVQRSPKDGGTIVSKRASDSHLTFQMAIFGEERPAPYHNALQFGTGNADHVLDVFHHSKPVPGGTAGWRFVTVTYQGQTLRYYLDGELISEEHIRTPLAPCDAPMLIGTAPQTLTTTGPDPLLGSIDELIIFRRALDADEIKAMHQATAP